MMLPPVAMPPLTVSVPPNVPSCCRDVSALTALSSVKSRLLMGMPCTIPELSVPPLPVEPLAPVAPPVPVVPVVPGMPFWPSVPFWPFSPEPPLPPLPATELPPPPSLLPPDPASPGLAPLAKAGA